MAEATKPTEPPAKTPKPAAKTPGAAEAKPPARPAAKAPAPSEPKAAAPSPKAGAKPAREAKADEVKIVDKPTEAKHAAAPKPTLTEATRAGLRLRAAISGRRPRFRRQQWYEYKRLADSGWRRPTGVDSAMRRHFGYETKVVRVGFLGPASVRGLHPSGFEEVRVEHVEDLGRIDPKRQAARVSGRLGARALKLVYAEADKRGVRVLNRRQLK